MVSILFGKVSQGSYGLKGSRSMNLLCGESILPISLIIHVLRLVHWVVTRTLAATYTCVRGSIYMYIPITSDCVYVQFIFSNQILSLFSYVFVFLGYTCVLHSILFFLSLPCVYIPPPSSPHILLPRTNLLPHVQLSILPHHPPLPASAPHITSTTFIILTLHYFHLASSS